MMRINKQTGYAVIVVLVVLQLYSLIKISSLQNMIENTGNTLHSVENQLSDQINSIYQNVDDKLSEQASLIHNAAVTVGKLDVNALTVPLTFVVEPKAVTETMVVSLDFNGEIVSLDKSGLRYSATKDFEISDSIFPKIIIEDGGVKKLEEHGGLNLSDIKELIFPHLFVHFYGDSAYKLNEYRANGRIDIDYKQSFQNNPFVDVKYVVKIDGKTIKQTAVQLSQDISIGWDTFDIDDKFTMNDGETLTANIVAKDSLGFVHEYSVIHFVAGAKAQREPSYGQEKITTPKGETVHMFD